MKKRVTLKILGSDSPELEDVEIEPGTTMADIKRELNADKERELNIPMEYKAFRRATNEYLKDSIDLYKVLDDGEKIELQPKSELGSLEGGKSSLIFLFSSIWRPIDIETPIRKIKPKVKRITHKRVIQPAEKIGIEAELKNLGWGKQGKDFYGYIKGRYASYECYLLWKGRGKYELYIFNPPLRVLTGKHKYCFNYVRDGWYFVHFLYGENPLVKITRLQDYIKKRGE